MRCRACNCALNDYEATLKDDPDGTYLDLCSYCISPVDDSDVGTFDIQVVEVQPDDSELFPDDFEADDGFERNGSRN